MRKPRPATWPHTTGWTPFGYESGSGSDALAPATFSLDCSTPKGHLRYEAARDWLRAAEREAKLDPVKGHAFHAYRRLWAIARKDLPDVDVAQAGGWTSLQALKEAYQQPDGRTMLKVVTHDSELREVG